MSDTVSNFLINTDFNAMKSADNIYSASVTIPAGTVSDGQQWSSNIIVPQGDYTIMSMTTIDGITAAPSAVVGLGSGIGSITIATAFKRVSSNSIQLLVEVDVSGGGSASTAAHIITGSFIIIPSPF